MSVTETILDVGRDLAVGQSLMAECPFCLAPEKKLAITRYSDGLGYICFRASCGARGSAGVGCPRSVLPPRPQEFTPSPCPYVLGDSDEGYAGQLLARIEPLYWWGTSSAGNDRIVYSLGDFSGKNRGWQSRSRQKWITSGRTTPGPLYGYYTSSYLPPLSVWVVEDPLSAIRLAEADKSAIALLGIGMDDAIIDELWDEYPSCKRLYVALDPGAEDAARKIVTRLRFHHGLDAIQVVLPDDIHRLDSATFQNIIEAYP